MYFFLESFFLRNLKNDNNHPPPPNEKDFNMILKYLFIYFIFFIITVIMIVLIILIVLYIINKIKINNNNNEIIEETNFKKIKNEENKYLKLSIKKESSFGYEKLPNNNNNVKNNKNNYTNQIIEIVNTAAPIPNI